MKLEIGKDILRDYTKATSREWIETNGLGGYSSSTLSGTNTRSYHGMYVVATNPPVGREVLLSRLEEEIITNGQSHFLSCNEFPNHIFKTPLSYLQEFSKDPFPAFTYKIKDLELKKTICFIHNTNTLAITYEIIKAEKDFVMELKPYIAYRDFHSVGKVNQDINQKAVFHENVLKIHPYPDHLPLYIYVSNCAFRFNPEWNHNFEYSTERERGHAFTEDLFMHGQFILALSEGDKVHITISTELLEEKDSFQLMKNEMIRRNSLYENLPVKDDFSKLLSLAADQFLVKRGELKTIIAGYHWFSDWGRDTMISLPGLCLVNGRFSEAKKILRAFALSLDKGMIPNRFPDESETPEYNTVDATLWYFIAIWKYYQYSQDKVFILHEMLPVMEEIITWHKKGTRYRIKLEEDGLISAGEPGVQLTWMDAKVGDWVVTPRYGKAVEINALWYNAIKIIREFYILKEDSAKAESNEALAQKIRTSFLKEFVNEEKGFLYDYTCNNIKHDELRPNQIFAISLPFELINKEFSLSILKKTEEKLLTPFGLRSLSPDDKNYIGVYQGDQLSRDGSYHQGTVWSWLLGPYITAKIKIEGEEGRKDIQLFLKVFEKHFLEAGIGTISEIFDGDFPHYPNGCIAQAWSVAEILRAYIEDVLGLGNGCSTIVKEIPLTVDDKLV